MFFERNDGLNYLLSFNEKRVVNIVWTSSGTSQDQLLYTTYTCGSKAFSGKKIHTKYVKIYGAIVVIAVVHVDFSFIDSDLVTRMRLQHVKSFFSNKLIAGMESKPF